MAKTIVVKQVGSPIRRPAMQRQTLVGLGLNKMHKHPRARGHARRSAAWWPRSRTWCRSSRSGADRPRSVQTPYRFLYVRYGNAASAVQKSADAVVGPSCRSGSHPARRSDMKLNELQRQAGRGTSQEARRPRPGLGPRQDRRPRHQGPEIALGRGHQRLRGRPDAALPAPAQARLQQAEPQAVRRRQPGPDPEVHRRRQAGRGDHRDRAGRQRARAPQARRHPRAGQGRARPRRSSSPSPAPPSRRSRRSRRPAARSR